MSCPRCGGMSATELAEAMDALVCEKTIFEGSYCHCDDIESSSPTGSRPEEKTNPLERTNDPITSERRAP